MPTVVIPGDWIAVWATATGAIVSVGSIILTPADGGSTVNAVTRLNAAGLSVTDLGLSPPLPGSVWNTVTHVFDAGPVRHSILSLGAFVKRFTTVELEDLQNLLATGTQVQKNKLSAFRQYLSDQGIADCNDAYIITSVNLMETAGIIGVGRAVVILA